MGITFSGGFKPPSLDLEKTLKQQLEREKANMDLRIQSGRNVDGQSMGSYSPEYAKYRADLGRQTGTKDLTLKGEMLRSIRIKVTRAANLLIGEIYFGSSNTQYRRVFKRPRKGKTSSTTSSNTVDRAKGNQKRFHFFGFSKDQFQRIRDALKSSIK